MGKYFSIDELCKSRTADARGLVNIPNDEQRENLEALIKNVLDPTREAVGFAISVSSGFRGAALNAAVGGATHSQHKKGEAADLTTWDKAKNEQIFEYIRAMLDFDQLINERDFQWVHVSFKRGGGNRRQVLESPAPGVYRNV